VTPGRRLFLNLASVGVLTAVTVGWVVGGAEGIAPRHPSFAMAADFVASGNSSTNQSIGVVIVDRRGEPHARASWSCNYPLPEGWQRLPHQRQPRPSKSAGRCAPGDLGNDAASSSTAAASLVAALEDWADERPGTLARARLESVDLDSGAIDEGFIWPVDGEVLSGFGPRDGGMHTGLDIASDTGDPIAASAGGKVTLSDVYYGYGNTVMIDHGGGLTTLYGHLSSQTVVEGDVVEQGDVIGSVGCTGDCSGDHLHFEVRVTEEPVPPLPYLSLPADLTASAARTDPYALKQPLAAR
jgi:Peptidase family M23